MPPRANSLRVQSSKTRPLSTRFFFCVTLMATTTKRRKNGAPSPLGESAHEAAIQKSFAHSCAGLLESGGLAKKNDPVVCLVTTASFNHPLVVQLGRCPMLRVREAGIEHVTFLLPAKKTAFLVVGGCAGEESGEEAATLAMLQRKNVFISSKQQLVTAGSNFGSVVILVMEDSGLFNVLSIDSIAVPSVTVLFCRNNDEAVAHVLHRASLPDLAARQANHAAALRSLYSQSSLQSRVARAIPMVPPTANLQPDECLELLSGRASLDICTDHFGWSAETARTVLQAIATDSKKEN